MRSPPPGAFFDPVMTLNLKSAWLVRKASPSRMGEGGVIINIASQARRDGGGPGVSIYAAATGAMISWTRGLAKELGPKGIRVNALAPGLIGTRFHDEFSKPRATPTSPTRPRCGAKDTRTRSRARWRSSRRPARRSSPG